MEVAWTKLAVERLNAFVDYMAKDDPQKATNWAISVQERVNQLVDHPESGRVIPEFNETSRRELVIGNYPIFIELIMKEKPSTY